MLYIINVKDGPNELSFVFTEVYEMTNFVRTIIEHGNNYEITIITEEKIEEA